MDTSGDGPPVPTHWNDKDKSPLLEVAQVPPPAPAPPSNSAGCASRSSYHTKLTRVDVSNATAQWAQLPRDKPTSLGGFVAPVVDQPGGGDVRDRT